MSAPLAIGAIAALAAAAELSRRGSRPKPSEADKARIAELVRSGRVYEAQQLSESLGRERLDLSGANLTGANLYRANLRGADLTEANLREADLSEVNLTVANLSGANLTGADLSGVYLNETTGIDIGPDRVFKGAPDGYRIQRSRLSGRDYGLVQTGD